VALSTPTGAGNVTTANAPVAAAITVSKPSNTADGDALVAFVYFRNANGTLAPAAGWTLLGPANTTFETFAAYIKPIPVAASESATDYTFSVTGTGSQRCAGMIFRVTGANLSALLDASGSLAAYTGTASVVLPAVTASSAFTLLLGFAINNNNTTGAASTFTAAGGLTTVGSSTVDNGTTATSTIWVGSQVLSAAGTTGTRTPTMSPAAANSGGFMVTVAGIPAATSAPDLGQPQKVNSMDTVTVTATIAGTVSAWTWTTDGPALSGSGNTRTFTAPTTIDGTTVTVTAYATIGGVDSPVGSVVITIRAHQWWVLRASGWQPFINPVVI
jgi:hypothetical protein